MTSRTELRLRALDAVVEWDEYLQGYDAKGNIILCICGEPFPGEDHQCPYDDQPDEEFTW